MNRQKQNWAVGETVKVGFLKLRVLAKVATPGNWLPDQYAMTDATGQRFYRFVPHNGLTRTANLTEAMEWA
jgi:hypothetical protein